MTKWEKAKTKYLETVNEVAVKALVAGLLGLNVPTSLGTFVDRGQFPMRLRIDYRESSESLAHNGYRST